MFTSSNKELIVFNGEIYNYIEIKSELTSKGIKFNSESDTEILLKSIKFWGPEKACKKFNGMWSFIYFDLNKNLMHMSRDRFGKKPLYYFISNNGIYFASEAKSLLSMLDKKFELNYQLISEFTFQSQINTSSEYILKGINQVSPSFIYTLNMHEKIKLEKKIKYWDYPKIEDTNIIFTESVKSVRDTFFNAVEVRLRSDAPMGILLSGGLDSSSIASIVKEISNDNLMLFSAVDNDPKYDESPFIDIMSKYLNADVKKINLSLEKENIFDLLEYLIWINDQPIPSFSNLTHYLLIKKASDHGIKVLMTGQGADELLCGYRKYAMFYIKNSFLNGDFLKAYRLFYQFLRNGTIINQFNFADAKRYRRSMIKSDFIRTGSYNLKNLNLLDLGVKKHESLISRQIKDFKYFSLPQILHTEDRMSMAASSEMRVPFIDYRLVELLLPMKINKKINNGWSKYIFRKALEPYLPKEIVWRKDKQNFGNSQGQLLKGKSKSKIIEDYYSSSSLIFDKKLFDRKKLINHYKSFCSNTSRVGAAPYKEIFFYNIS